MADASAPSPVVQELYKATVGEKSQDYYLRQFARFDQAGKTSATWHWPASLSTLNWLAWRGMWSADLVFAAACRAISKPPSPLWMASSSTMAMRAWFRT